MNTVEMYNKKINELRLYMNKKDVYFEFLKLSSSFYVPESLLITTGGYKRVDHYIQILQAYACVNNGWDENYKKHNDFFQNEGSIFDIWFWNNRNYDCKIVKIIKAKTKEILNMAYEIYLDQQQTMSIKKGDIIDIYSDPNDKTNAIRVICTHDSDSKVAYVSVMSIKDFKIRKNLIKRKYVSEIICNVSDL